MYRLLIVDDEPHVTDWLAELFGGMEDMPLDICKACSAKTALDLLNRSRIDIVLTDINMPRMSGLEMMKIIRSSWPECKVIFLTGHNDFEYAYEAIRNEVSGYLLKTENDREIVSSVEKAIRQIEEARRIDMLLYRSQEQLAQALPLMRKDFVVSQLDDNGEVRLPDAGQLEQLEIPLNADDPVHLLLARLDNTAAMRLSPSGNALFFQANAVVERFMGFAFRNFFSPVGSNSAVWFLQPKAPGKDFCIDAAGAVQTKAEVYLRDLLDTVQASIRETLHCTVSFAFTAEACGWGGIPAKYKCLKEILDISPDAETIVTDIGFTELRAPDTARDPLLALGMAEKLGGCLERGDKAGALGIIGDFAGRTDSVGAMNYGPAMEAYFTLSLRLLSYINRKDLTERIAVKCGLHRLMRPDEHRSWQEAAGYLESIVGCILEARSGFINDMEESVVNRVKRYVDNHMHEDVSLVRLAEVVHFNPSYLSRFFKQVTDTNLADYIFSAKVGRARELLADSRYKIHEVASAVGFESSTYFAKFFRRMTGMNPQEYRDGLNR